jgi:LysM repeat protein
MRRNVFALTCASIVVMLSASACVQTPDIPAEPTVASTPRPEATPTARPVVLSPANTYKVEEGDNLSTIAEKHGVTVAEILELNGMVDPNSLKAGDQILIPSPGAGEWLAPLPTLPATEDPPFSVKAAVSGDYPVKNGTVVVYGTLTRYGVGVPGASLSVVVHWPNGDQELQSEKATDLGGRSWVELLVPDLQVSEPVVVDVSITYGGKSYQAKTHFRPR